MAGAAEAAHCAEGACAAGRIIELQVARPARLPTSCTLPSRVIQQLARLHAFQRQFGWRATGSKLWRMARHRLAAAGQAQWQAAPGLHTSPDWASPFPAPQAAHGGRVAPRFFLVPRSSRRRVTLLCERLEARRLCDASRTALALAVVTANRLQADLRLIATQQAPDPGALNALLRSQGLALNGECILAGPLPAHTGIEFDRLDGELMLAASCACATDCLNEVPAADLVCLLHADDSAVLEAAQAGASPLLQRTDLRWVVCSGSLQQQLASRGFTAVAQQALSFEPAFPLAAGEPVSLEARRHLLLQLTGPADRERVAIALAALESALADGVLGPQPWDIVFAGAELPQVALADGRRPLRIDDLEVPAAWQRLRTVDVVLALPLPGVPLLAPWLRSATGAVVVACTGSATTSADNPAERVIHCALERSAIVQALRRASECIGHDVRPLHQQASAGVDGVGSAAGDWSHALSATASSLAAGR